jgi:predicted dehydrogenase
MIVIIGCGKIAAQHLGRLKGRSELGFFSRSPDTAQVFSEKFGGFLYRRFEDVVADPKVRALWITSPPESHKDYLIPAIQKNLAIFCEKPLCTNATDLSLVFAAAQNHPGARLMIGENYLYKPVLRQIQMWLSAGDLGPIKKVLIKKEFTQGARTWKAGLGALLEGGIHFVSFLNELFEPHLLSVEESTLKMNQDGVDRSAVVRARSSGGAVAELRYSWATPAALKGLFQHSRIECENGSIVFESNGLYARRVGPSGAQTKVFLSDVAGFQAMTDDFFKCINPGMWAPVSSLQKAKRDLDFVFETYRKALPLKTS